MPSTYNELRELYRRLARMTEPDRELSDDILSALVHVNAYDARRFYGSGDNYTESIDAALRLVDRTYPDCQVELQRRFAHQYIARVFRGCWYGAATAPAALLLALLAALMREAAQREALEWVPVMLVGGGIY